MPPWLADLLTSAASSALASRIGSSQPSGDGRLRTASGQLASEALAAQRALQPPSDGGGYVSNFYIPPGGFTGFAQMTPASKAALSKVGGSRRRRKRRAKKKAARRTTRKAARRTTRKAKRFVKGSAAAKRHMAKLRRMRK